jgi:thiol-disulfide isomerase/thioredoxin
MMGRSTTCAPNRDVPVARRPRAGGLRVALGLAGAVLLAAGCGGGDGGLPAAPPRVGDAVPDLTFAVLEGDSLALPELAGSPALINLWATWCPPCRAEIPFLQTLHEEYGPRGLQVVGISEDNAGALDQVEDFLGEAGVTYANVLDPRSEAMDAFRLLGLPATYLVDAEGRIVLVRAGPVSEADTEFLDTIEALVAGS